MNSQEYDESKIKTLSSLEHIRKRPGMYIGRLGDGSNPDDGIYILLKEVLDNAVDEYIMGFGKRIEVTIDRAGKCMRKNGFVYEQDGALWLKMTAWGDEKDEVLVRANGIPTYFAADIAYHKNKFARGFDWVINVWGADHHGHVARMKAALAALSYDPERLDVILIQLVRLYRGGEVLRMSKRTGVTVSLDELIDEVGRDAARFFFVMRNPDSHLDFDLELAQKQSQENPVYYVQYAYARIKSIFRQAQAMQISLPPKIGRAHV